jgi:sugar/nucleoside kinase (ribokinase family)
VPAESGAVVCVGTISRVTCLPVADLRLSGYGQTVQRTVVLGNDAVIVAQHLSRRGQPVRAALLCPTTADLALLRGSQPAAMRVQPIDTRPGPVTASTVLQTPTGQRHWLLPPPATPRQPLDLAGARWQYLDLYDEIEDYLIEQLHQQPAHADRRLIVNLSSSRPLDKASRLADLRPFLVQASHHGPETLPDAAAALRDAASASYAVATAGPAGAALASATGPHLTTPCPAVPRARLGAGAAFSAGLVCAALAGTGGQNLLDAAADSATAWLTEALAGSR